MKSPENRERLRRLEEEVSLLRDRLARLERDPARRGSPGVEELLRRRGLAVSRDAGRPAPLLPSGEAGEERFYRLLQRYSFRIFMRDLIGRPEGISAAAGCRYCSASSVRRYLAELSALGLAEAAGGGRFRLVRKEVRSFGETLEWFVAEALRRDLGLPVERGLVFPGLPAGGDYDIVAAAGNGVVYLEVKSSPPKHIEEREVAAFVRRWRDLAPRAALLLVDTQLRLRDKIIPLLREAMGGETPVRLREGMWRCGSAIRVLSSKPSLLHNLRACFADLYREEILV